ncbi:MAG TPA: dihydroorotate dehydrogenase [Candidatus Bathyarchaeota archaeon]|nr:dihydroorotate dehydrogenase [Candidatus Bathyarchaeota archaeon]
MVRLDVIVGGLRLRNPVMLSAGVLGISHRTLRRVYEAGAGAVVTKSIGAEPRRGFKNPTLVDLGVGVLNAMGLPNPGVKEFVKEVEALKRDGVCVVASVYGFRAEEYAQVAGELCDAGADAVELNYSCPHVSQVGLIGQNPQLVAEVTETVKHSVSKPVYVKLTPNVTDIASIAKAAEEAGADAITAINTVRAMAIDIEFQRPVLSAVYGGLSGPAIKPIALRAVYEIYEAVEIPVIGVGGITSWRDAVEFFLAGASAIQVGTAVYLKGLSIFRQITQGLKRYLERKGCSTIEEIVGKAHKHSSSPK